MARRDLSASSVEHHCCASAGHDKAKCHANRQSHAFTLIELLVVITIIVVLMDCSFPRFAACRSGQKTQAKTISLKS
jgi:prepilin-type N-terminal cleavage/methylation domain-containing protein